MEAEYQREKRCSVFKKLESYLSMKRRSSSKKGGSGRLVAPTGCFSVYVGPEKQRFVIKAKFANHPLFKMLLEDAELEYGFTSEGPLLIPCNVDLFSKILAEMDCGEDDQFHDHHAFNGYGGSCTPFNPARRLGKVGFARGCSSYGLLTPPRLLKINNF